MQKICLHCDSPFEATRASKKYCCDSCRQLAFYKRSDLSEITTAETSTYLTTEERIALIEAAEAAEDNPDTVKHQGVSVNNNVCFTATLHSLTPVSVKPDALIVNNNADFIATAHGNNPLTVKPATVHVKENVKNSTSQSVKTNAPQIQTIAPEKETYDCVESAFVERIQQFAEYSDHYSRFKEPNSFWTTYQLEDIKWISVRLRCLLENLLRLSSELALPKTMLTELRDGFTNLTSSSPFRYLPANYPFKGLISELEQKLSQLIHQQKKQDCIRITISRNRRAELIATRFMLAALVPKVAFRELWAKPTKKESFNNYKKQKR